jgi:hypothetical protein
VEFLDQLSKYWFIKKVLCSMKPLIPVIVRSQSAIRMRNSFKKSSDSTEMST